MIGCVGNDEYGVIMKKELSAAGVDTSGIGQDPLPTGNAYIYVSDLGDNSIVVYPGANDALTPDKIGSMDELTCAQYCVMQLEIPIETVAHVCRKCKQNNVPVILNPAPAQPLSPEILSGLFLLVPNETELDLLVPGAGISYEDKAQILISAGVQNVIVTLGDKGCLWVNHEKAELFAAIHVDVVDSTAAGDTFIGVLVAALSERRPMGEAIRYASVAAGLSVRCAGAQPSIPSRAEIEAFLSAAK
jgi:ribokinase